MTISTRRYVEEADWDKKRESPKSSLRGRNDLIRLKKQLSEWETAIIKLYREVDDTITPQEFKQEILYRMEIEERPGEMPKGFHEYLATFLQSRKERPGATRTSWGKFASLQTHLLQFEKDTRQTLTFDKINWQFKEDFTAWMYAEPRSFAHNNASKMVASLRQVMKDAYRKKVHGNRIQEDSAFAISRVTTKNKVRLTVEELHALEQYDFSDRRNLDQARDLMLFGCWTGLRISDWWSVKRSNIRVLDGDEYIQVINRKTKNEVLIPMTPTVNRILDKYDFNFPKLHNVSFNRLIKQVCKLAIPDSSFNRVYSEGGQLKTATVPKYEFISSHAGRRSFASNLYELTGRAYPIMQITGHDSEKTFQNYVDLDKQEVVKSVRSPLLKLNNWRP